MNESTIRKAEFQDINIISRNHALMFEEMFSLKQQVLAKDKFDMLIETTTKKLMEELPKGVCNAWIVECDSKPIASGAITLISMTPSPFVSNHIYAYLHSLYTDKNHRGKGAAKLILKEAEDFCAENGIKRVLLIASDAGKPIYESIGYKEISFHYKQL